MPRRPSSSSILRSSTLPWGLGSTTTSAPRASSARRRSRSSTAPNTSTGLANSPVSGVRICASSGTSSRESTSTRCGWRGVAMARTVSAGLSSRTVPMPVRIAHARARQAWPSSRAAWPVIHWLVPSCSAVPPSIDAATLMRTHGSPRVMRETKPIFRSRASFSSRPQRTSTPASRNRCRPRPDTDGLGSSMAATTRATPARTSASAHGGVRPKWLHGSSVT
ncbi:hypothetical protein D3C72_1404330 [compost metagenome]